MAGHKARRKETLTRYNIESLEFRVLLSGTWTPLTNAPGSVGAMLLLPNGSVMATLDGSSFGSDWGLLTPSASGSYADGTWTKLANSHDTRWAFASQVLPDGRVFVAGGEYGSGGSTGETYDPLTNTWTELPSQDFGPILDSESALLPDGNVLLTPVLPGGTTTIFNPTTNSWSQGPQIIAQGVLADEDSWVKLADDSIIMTDGNAGLYTSERYVPSLNQWIDDATLPVSLFDLLKEEGAGILLSDGRAFFLGATGHTAIYTPTGSTAPGSWAPGPDIPDGLGTDDAPLAMLPDGTVLCCAGPSGTYNGPTTFFIYDPVANVFNPVTGAPSVKGAPYESRMLDLPNGQVLYSDGLSQLYIYTPGTASLTIAKPSITSIVNNPDGSLTLTGTGLNGIDAGAAYGDDAQMDSDYPIISLTSGTNVYYATSYNWSTTSIDTGPLAETVSFTLPLGIPSGTYLVTTSANGVSSAPVMLSVSTTPNNMPPTIATPAAASPSVVNGTTTALSVLGADDQGESDLVYTWTAASVPSGAPLPSFSLNGTNAAKNTTVTFHQPGNYTFSVISTDAGGLSTTSTVSVTVNQVEGGIDVYPAYPETPSSTNDQFVATATDQFGSALPVQPLTFTWSVIKGSGMISASGQYNSSSGTLATVQAANGSFTGTAQVRVLSLAWQSQDIGTPGMAGLSYDDGNGTFNMEGSGTGIAGQPSSFQFVYRLGYGDEIITARVAALQDNSAFAQAGIMIRNSLSGSDQFVGLFFDYTTGISLDYRAGYGGVVSQGAILSKKSLPVWLRLVRSGNNFSGYVSYDGINWLPVGTTSVPMPSDYSGLFVSSAASVAYDEKAPVLTTAAFDNVSIVSPVNTTTTTVSLTSGSNPSNATQSLTFVANVRTAPDGGAVTLEDSSNNYTIVGTGSLSGGSAILVVSADTLLAGTHELVAVYDGDGIDAPSQSAVYAQVVQVAITNAVINGDNPNGLYTAAGQPYDGAQRSMVEDVVYTFSEPVNIYYPPGAFTVTVAGSMGTVPSTIIAAPVPGSNNTQWAVSLTGQADGVLASIANGEYSIEINPAYVHSIANTNSVLAQGRTDYFYRLFGDINGDEVVNSTDNAQLQTALVTYNAAFDSNGDGFVNALDNARFKQSMSITFAGDGFTPTI